MPLITLNRINIDYSNPSFAVKKLHNHVDELREQVSFAMANIDDNGNEFSIIKRSLKTQAGLILEASESAASATLFASKVVDADGHIKAASIIAAVNESGDTDIKLSADHITLSGVTEMTGLAYVSGNLYVGDSEDETPKEIWLNGTLIRADGLNTMYLSGERIDLGHETYYTNVKAYNRVSITAGMGNEHGVFIEGKDIQISNRDFDNVNVVGTRTTSQRLYLSMNSSGVLQIESHDGNSVVIANFTGEVF